MAQVEAPLRPAAQGQTLNEIATEILRQSKVKSDFVVPSNSVRLYALEDKSADSVAVRFSNDSMYPLTKIAHGQLAEAIGVPAAYYKRMLQEAPDLLTVNANHWLDESGVDGKMIRTLDNRARAFLSDRYKIIDNEAIFSDLMSYLADAKATVESSALTEKKLYIRATFPVQGEVKKGDIVQAGVQITNSEVGQGALSAQAWTKRLICLNGMTITSEQFSTRSLHLGGNYGVGDDMRIFAHDTIEAEAKAVALKTRDLIQQCCDPKRFDEILHQMRTSTERKMQPIGVAGIQIVLPKEFGVTKDEGLRALEHFIGGGDLTQWGIANAITRTAQDVSTFDRRVELETLGGQLMNLSSAEFSKLDRMFAEAASK